MRGSYVSVSISKLAAGDSDDLSTVLDAGIVGQFGAYGDQNMDRALYGYGKTKIILMNTQNQMGKNTEFSI